ncbi:RNA polymerase sigma factor [Fervidibacillus albus]|uniref:Sigma-70 family RNA polymerase sigma factor n=1 Tax=Fervidibacillus albus TaxID=2980026 RepID=A0A9E8LV67_9BACI|nr:sigma-70 family RNA polymerase sigma factor [Fervidibacillus albus]WAA09920.1 sigma-70 family RNA polymerase sigma factor [Fervidibacillus albus]
MEDKEALQLIKNMTVGSKHSFDQFYETYIPFVFQIAYHMLGDYSEAEDVSQDVFLEVLQKIDQYDPKKGSVKAWLAVKTKSRCLDRLRKKRPVLVNRLEKMAREKEQGADMAFLEQIEKKIIFDALTHLPEAQREAIVRSYFNGETHREIAGAMEKPLGSIKSLIRYGLNNLRKQKNIVHWVESNGGDGK